MYPVLDAGFCRVENVDIYAILQRLWPYAYIPELERRVDQEPGQLLFASISAVFLYYFNSTYDQNAYRIMPSTIATTVAVVATFLPFFSSVWYSVSYSLDWYFGNNADGCRNPAALSIALVTIPVAIDQAFKSVCVFGVLLDETGFIEVVRFVSCERVGRLICARETQSICVPAFGAL